MYLFCKSYLGDLTRAHDLWKTIKKHNQDEIPFYLSVPQKDLESFKNFFSEDAQYINWVTDEEIIKLTPDSNLESYFKLDGRLSQQVVKSEFWRLFNHDITYLCIDSESQFIKDFYINDFLNDGVPYTVMHQNKELLQLATNKNVDKVAHHFFKDSHLVKKIFNRSGPDYDFGPTPVIWSSKVWKSLEDNYLKPKMMTFWDAIEKVPSELRWYGEALLAYKAIPVLPIEPIFRVYHYDWQFFTNKKLGEVPERLIVNYLGILKQSNWNYENDYGAHANRKSFASMLLRSIKRFFSRYR